MMIQFINGFIFVSQYRKKNRSHNLCAHFVYLYLSAEKVKPVERDLTFKFSDHPYKYFSE